MSFESTGFGDFSVSSGGDDGNFRKTKHAAVFLDPEKLNSTLHLPRVLKYFTSPAQYLRCISFTYPSDEREDEEGAVELKI
jgi:hypothetical protein